MDSLNIKTTEIIDLIQLCDSDPKLANDLIANSKEYPFIFYKTLLNIPYVLFKNNEFRSTNINKIIGIKGIIIKTGPILLRNTKTDFKCLKCNFSGSYEQSNDKLNLTTLCESCGSHRLIKKERLNEAIKTQVVRIQNIGDSSNISNLYEVSIEGQNAGKFCAGNEVIVAGILKMKWKVVKNNEKLQTSLYLHALFMSKIENDDLMEDEHFDNFSDFLQMETFDKRKFLIESFCSEIFGHSNVKLGILLTLANMHKEEFKTKNYTRQISHLLLIGNAATGKSHFLKFASKLVSPAVVTNGVSTSNAGLTSCAVKTGKDWSLEAGVLLLADMGVCCIDEFNKLKVNEKGGLLEAMEQQTLSVAKAGILSTLQARCSIMAACNVRNKYDKSKPVSENTLINTPLVSRFDLIFGLFNIKEETRDGNIADVILQRTYLENDELDKKSSKWPLNKLNKYLKSVRKTDIKIEEDISNILLAYYLKKKSKEGPNEFNTIRMLESLVRLSEAHAKLLGKCSVDEEDVYTVILLCETSIGSQSNLSLKYDYLFVSKKEFESGIEYIKKIYKLERAL